MMHWRACAPAFAATNCRACGRQAPAGGSTSMGHFPLPICSAPRPSTAKQQVKKLSRDPRHDALIVGAGPAGSAAAKLLAKAGWSIALVEKTQFPRAKVCGEFISAATMPVLEACGVAAQFVASAGPPVTRIGVYAGNAMLCAAHEQQLGRALGREHLDVMLRDAAVVAGAVLLQPAEVTGITPQD